ncbi:MAG: S41 family peptidase [Verrucomicrobiota bacterium]|nr:S41 family peptidase [Verrucomicrobiota bacterium]
MKKRAIYTLTLLLLGINLFFGAHIYLTSAQAAEKENVYEQMELFTRVLERVRQDYVDGDKLSYQELVHSALKGMLNTLDPHSEFMEPVKFTSFKATSEGQFGGVGIVVGLQDNMLTVIAPMEDTPAYKAGILPGDKIVKIEGQSTEKVNLTDAVKLLRGEPGSEVTITIMRPSSPQLKDYTLSRAIIKVDTAKDINDRREFPLGENKIGYVRLTQFGENTTEEFETALKKLHNQGMQGLILDLRNNPGGLLDQAVKVCDIFLPRGQLIVSTEGRSVQLRSEEYTATGRDEYPHLQLVILVNNGSASASEIVAGCLQDVGRAFVMGEQTFGKGSVQTLLPLQDGSALRLTTAKYYTPSHKVIHEKGITPDSIIAMSPEEEEALLIKRSVLSIESLEPSVRERVRTARDVQLERANDFLKGVIMYRDRAAGSRRSTGKFAAKKD